MKKGNYTQGTNEHSGYYTFEDGSHQHGLEFSYVVDKYPNLTMIVGDDLDMNNWKNLDLNKTDIWYFDSEHSEKQLRAELALYSPFFKKGTILLFDDIHLNEEMERVWNELKDKYDAYDATNLLHYTGFGVICV
mgnify:CR=1 FL=1